MIKSRSASTGPVPAPPQSIDAIRRRARHRLIGASMLVLVGVVGFSLLFDTQPRPLAVDIPIEIPAKSAPAPTPLPLEAPTAQAPVPAESVDQAATASTSAPQAAASQPVDVPETAPAPPPPPTE
ncbi:MAG: SPOR domain-containing protein, partial [Hydrogenophaga sp.]|nr:SPOR domain-containing protein [Hydrogenophaga sp.]